MEVFREGILSEGPSFFSQGIDGKPEAFSLHAVGNADRFYPAGLTAQQAMTTGASGISQISGMPLIVSRPGAVIDAVKIDVTVAAGAGGTLRMGIYDADPRSQLPINLLLDTGNTANDVAAAARTFTGLAFRPIASKLYWLVVNTEVSGCTYRAWGISVPIIGVFGVTVASAGTGARCWVFNNNGPYAALPATFPLVGSSIQPLSSGTPPAVCVRFSA